MVFVRICREPYHINFIKIMNMKIKTLFNPVSAALMLFTAVSLTSCEKNKAGDGRGFAEFNAGPLDDFVSSKGDTSPDTSTLRYFQVLISVETSGGEPVFTDKLLPAYFFGSVFISENVELESGEYKLTKFLVINPAGVVIHAAPLEGSPFAYLVNKPLPIGFSVFPDATTRITPEVLPVKGSDPGQFGYAGFGVHVVIPLDFWTICVLDPGNPMIMAPVQVTTARLTVHDGTGWHYSYKLEASVNHVVIRGGAEMYTFIIEKEGFQPARFRYSARELMSSTRENPVILRLPWDYRYRKLVLQPGPGDGKDAMISNLEPDKNFGDHRYFEATFMSEPILTVMRSNRSLIRFNLDTLPVNAAIEKVMLELFYDLPVAFDSTYRTDVYPSPGVAWYGGVLQKVIEPWDEHGVTWNSQPKTTEINQVYIPPFIRNCNFITVDVTGLFVHGEAVDAPDHGIMFRLWPVERFPGFRFASSDYHDARLRPRLTVFYMPR
jgi:hypothetical protein